MNDKQCFNVLINAEILLSVRLWGWNGTRNTGTSLPLVKYYVECNYNDGSTPIQMGTGTIVYLIIYH